jgi:hypothetical protein
MKRIYLLLITFLFVFQSYGQQMLNDNFDYIAGTDITANTWTLNGFPPTNPIKIVSPGLSFTGYVNSGVGNSAYIKSTGMDVFKAGTNTVNTGNVYAAFMYKVDTVGTGDYFFGFFNTLNTTTYLGKVYLRAAGAGFYRIGLSKTTEGPTYSADSFPLGTTSMIVVKYSFVTGTNNDTATLYNITGSFPSSEPTTPTIITNGNGSPDATNIARLGIRQGATVQGSSLSFDGIRMGQKWIDLNAAATFNPGVLPFIFVNNITANTARINWNRPSNYNSSYHKILIFLKKGSNIAPGAPTKGLNSYNADSNFAGSGTPYQFDTAVCVFKGDTTFVNIVGLQASTRYIAMGYAVSIGDSIFSTATLSTSFLTPTTAPGNMFGANFTATSKNSARINWNKGGNYNNVNHTTLVFVKELNAVTAGANTRDPNFIIADTSFLSTTSSKYQNDPLAKCVYNGDLTSVEISGLKAGTRYYILIVGVNVFDSNYATTPSNATGITPTGGPAAITTFRFTGRLENNSTVSWVKPLGYIDSLYTILIFMRKDTTNLSFPAATALATSYVADSNLLGVGSAFENDPLAKCIYNGDGNGVSVRNLIINTRYYLIGYAVKTDSNLYSIPNIINNRTMVDSVTNIIGVGASATSATLTWTSPANFVNGTHRYLVFVKAGSPVTVGNPTRAENRYTANANFGSGTAYQNDASASCVYRNGFNSVTVNNLVFGVTYYATVLVIRVADSVYTRANSGTMKTLGFPPAAKIGPLVKTSMTTGVVDSINKRATVRGIVHGPNFRTGGGYLFVVRDETGGISISSTTKTFGYTPKEGDSIEATGTVTQVNGLATLSVLDTVILFYGGYNIAKPKIYTKPDENSENDLVVYTRLVLPVKITNWPTTGTVISINTYTGDTVRIRIYQITAFGGGPAPQAEFSMTGIGAQASTSNTAPFAFNGYNVIPRRTSDYSQNTGDSISSFPLLTPAPLTTYLITDTSALFTVVSGSSKVVKGIGTINYVMLFDESNGDFSLPMFGKSTNNGGLDTLGSASFGSLLASLPLLNPGDSMLVKVTMMAYMNSITVLADQQRLVVFKLPARPLGVATTGGGIDFNVYPNPANNLVNIEANMLIEHIQIFDLQGKLVVDVINQNSASTENLTDGMYIISVETKQGRSLKRLQIQH